MKLYKWIIIGTLIALASGIGFVVFQVWLGNWLAKRQIERWSEIKVSLTPPTPDLPVEMIGQQVEWRVRYPSSQRLQSDPHLVDNFTQETNADQAQLDDVRLVNELHMWKDCNIRVFLKSKDVRHTFFLPNMRLRQEVEPGRVIPVWFNAIQSNVTWDAKKGDWKCESKFEFVCIEHYSKTNPRMKGLLFVHESKDDFLNWIRQAEKIGPN